MLLIPSRLCNIFGVRTECWDLASTLNCLGIRNRWPQSLRLLHKKRDVFWEGLRMFVGGFKCVSVACSVSSPPNWIWGRAACILIVISAKLAYCHILLLNLLFVDTASPNFWFSICFSFNALLLKPLSGRALVQRGEGRVGGQLFLGGWC